MIPHLEAFLLGAAVLQFAIAGLNLFLVPLLGWKEDVQRLPLLLREVFTVHAWFISVTLLIFGALTWRFSADLGAGSSAMGRWLAGTIGLFWALRTVLQVVYYSSSHWRGKPARTAVHSILLIVYGGFAVTYLLAAIRLKL